MYTHLGGSHESSDHQVCQTLRWVIGLLVVIFLHRCRSRFTLEIEFGFSTRLQLPGDQDGQSR